MEEFHMAMFESSEHLHKSPAWMQGKRKTPNIIMGLELCIEP
jgi:hypothetical protein